jgi:ABC-type nitrate/sulfonate/bicarbonate transport system permease component
LLAALVGAWQVAVDTGFLANAFNIERFLIPSPSEIASALWDNRSLLAENTWVTLREVLLGFVCGLLAGLGFAVLLHLSATLRRAAYPLLVASQAVPIVAIAPILIVLFGFGIGPKLVIVGLICFFPITVNALDGLRSVQPDAVKMMRSLDASRWQTFQRVEAPTALPFAFSGAKVAVAVAVIGAVFAEWAASSVGNGGLGSLIREDTALLQTARLFAEVFLLSLMAIALFGLLALVERLVVTWR